MSIKTFIFAVLISTTFNVAWAEKMLPQYEIEKAIAMAKDYVKKNKIDVSQSFISSMTYGNQASYHVYGWRIEWQKKKDMKGGQTYIFILNDGRVEVGYGE